MIPQQGIIITDGMKVTNRKWSNPETGCSPNFWSRCIGWYGAAIVDVLDFLPQETADATALYRFCRDWLKRL